MSGTKQAARVMDAVMADISAHMNAPCWPASADGLTGLQHVQSLRTPEYIARANAEWDAIPTDTAELTAWMRGEGGAA